jgi:hypothetical protein
VGAIVRDLRSRFQIAESALEEPKNQIAQRVLGTVESIAYPCLMIGSGSAPTIIAAWLTAKALGSWSGWQTSNGEDPHRGRRRLYAYILANAFQVAWGGLIAALLRLSR